MAGVVFLDVDTQRDLMEVTGSFYVPGAQTILPALRRLHGWLTSGERGRHVATACLHEPQDEEIAAAKPDYKQTFPPHCLRQTPGQEKIAETACSHPLEIPTDPRDPEALASQVRAWTGEILIVKNRFDPFSNPNTEVLLRALAPDRIVVYGVALDLAVRLALEGLLERDFRDLWLLSDATRPIKFKERDTLLGELRERGVRLATTRDLVGAPAAAAGTGRTS